MSKQLPLDLTASALPDEVQLLVKLLIEGRVNDLIIIARVDENTFVEGIFEDVNDSGSGNVYGVLGAIEAIKRDWMRATVDSRVPYVEPDELIDDEEDED